MQFQYISCYGLSYRETPERKRLREFQYISCYGLSLLFCECGTAMSNFNTSHVTVYLHSNVSFATMPKYFNTSHVTVYHNVDFADKTQFIYFNTSHVTVYRKQYGGKRQWQKYFNTSHVTVYLMILSHSYLGIFHHFLYSTSFQHFLPADYKI